MTSIIAAALFAAVCPQDFFGSAVVANYWYKKDERGRGDQICEKSKPKSFPAFVLSSDTFILSDPAVRAKHLDHIDVFFNGKSYSATEISRTEFPDTVTLKTSEPVADVKPLEFADGVAVQGLGWSIYGNELAVEAVNVSTNDRGKVSVRSKRAFRQGQGNTVYFDKENRPVGIDFGDRLEVSDERWRASAPSAYKSLPASSYEEAASAIEKRVAGASLILVVHLESEDNDANRDYGESSQNEFDAIGMVIGGRVIMPSRMPGEKIARLKSVEATFADGSKTNLIFVGALAEWNGIMFDLPEGCANKVGSLELDEMDPFALDGTRAWSVNLENENSAIIATAMRMSFRGVSTLRGAELSFSIDWGNHKPNGNADIASWEDIEMAMSSRTRKSELVVSAEGKLAGIALQRRFGRNRWDNEEEQLSMIELKRIIAGEVFNDEFVPRSKDDRNRLVWLGVEAIPLTVALAREKNAQSYLSDYSRPPLVTEVYAGSPAEKCGLKIGDILLSVRRGNAAERKLESGYDYGGDWSSYFESDYITFGRYSRGTPWPDVEDAINSSLTEFGAGAKLKIYYARDGKRCETEVKLEPAPVHYQNAKKTRNRTLGISVKDMTFEVRKYFKFDENSPGVVIAKIKPGSPSAVAGLKSFELVIEVNGAEVKDAKDFAAKVKGVDDLVFKVRRLAQTRMVKIHVDKSAEKDADKKDDVKKDGEAK